MLAHVEAPLRQRGCAKLDLQIRAGDDAVAVHRTLGYAVDPVVSMGRRLIEDSPSTRAQSAGTASG